MVLLAGDHWWGRGLYVQSPNYPQEPTPVVFNSSGGPGLADRAGYYYHAPGDARIYKVVNTLSRHILGASLHQCMIVGITNADLNQWEGPYGQTYGEGCAPFASFAWTSQVPNGGGSLGNAFLYGVYTYSDNQTAFNSVFNDAQIYMYDFDAPTGPPGFAGPQIMAPKTPPDWMTNADDPISATARDRSTGVKSITFYGPASWTYNGMNGQSGITIENPRCLYGPCDRASGQQYQQFTAEVPIGNMPDGEHVITAIARDAAGNTSPMSSPYPLRFDSAGPQVSLFGSLWDARTGAALETGWYELVATAADHGSGAKRTRVTLDGTQITESAADQCPAADGSCTLNYRVNIDTLLPGNHTIVVEATDERGNVSSREFSFQVACEGGDDCSAIPDDPGVVLEEVGETAQIEIPIDEPSDGLIGTSAGAVTPMTDAAPRIIRSCAGGRNLPVAGNPNEIGARIWFRRGQFSKKLFWDLYLTQSERGRHGRFVTVSMPYASVNGQPINPPYAPHLRLASYDFHGSIRKYQKIGGGEGVIETGDTLHFRYDVWSVKLVGRLWARVGSIMTVTCIVPEPGAG